MWGECRSGGIGRHACFRDMYLHGCGSSSLPYWFTHLYASVILHKLLQLLLTRLISIFFPIKSVCKCISNSYANSTLLHYRLRSSIVIIRPLGIINTTTWEKITHNRHKDYQPNKTKNSIPQIFPVLNIIFIKFPRLYHPK